MPARILVVDDDPTNVEVLTAWLESEHYVVSTAADGFEALAKIEAEKPDIILLDVMLPEIEGFEVCRRIKSDPATEHIPVIMVTALSDVDDLVKGFEAGADDFVTKPFSGLARTRAMSARPLNGLVTKSSAPASKPFTRSSTSERAVTMMTGMCSVAGSDLMRRQTSKPSISGSITSSKMMSGFSASIFASASNPSAAVLTT